MLSKKYCKIDWNRVTSGNLCKYIYHFVETLNMKKCNILNNDVEKLYNFVAL